MKENKLIEAEIVESKIIACNIRKLKLEFNFPEYAFSPGQWIDLHIEQAGKNIGGYTITSKQSDKNFIELIVRKSTFHPVTIFLHQDNIIGKKVKITEGQGKFTLQHRSMKTAPIFVAGGIGLTPLISMAKTLDEKNLPYNLLYSIKKIEDNILASEKIKYSQLFLTQSDRRIKIDDLLINNPNNRDIYICGPKTMIDEFNNQLKNIDYPKELIHFEKWW